MNRLRTLSVLCAVAAFAVAGTFTASTVIADPAPAGTGDRQVVEAVPDKADPNHIAPDRVLTAAEGMAIKQRIASQRALAPQWHWMGNYANPGDAAAVANMPPASGAGAIMFEVADNGLVPAWMYY
ncbi:hypothetical protein AB0H12_01445 [Actinosynnema sp. NPDC023794]